MKDAMDAVEKRTRTAPDEDEDDVAGEVDANRLGRRPPSTPPPVDATPAASYQQATQALDQAVVKAQQEVQEIKDKWLRAAADLDNFKKRSAKEREDAVKFGNERLLRDLLPVLDDLDRTIEASPAPPGSAVAQLLDGIRLIQKKFVAQLEKNGVEGFNSLGQTFDPAQHEAVQQVYSTTTPAGAVAQELRRGFFLGGRLLRPALVAVSLGPKDGSKE